MSAPEHLQRDHNEVDNRMASAFGARLRIGLNGPLAQVKMHISGLISLPPKWMTHAREICPMKFLLTARSPQLLFPDVPRIYGQ